MNTGGSIHHAFHRHDAVLVIDLVVSERISIRWRTGDAAPVFISCRSRSCSSSWWTAEA